MDDMHQPFITEEYVKMLSKYAKISYIKETPTIQGKTYFWANKEFEGIKKQYVVESKYNSPKLYFVKYPSTYQETFDGYRRDFRKSLNQSKKVLTLEVKNSNSVEDPIVHYNIYKEVMIRNNTFVFPYSFFKDVFNLSFGKVYEAKYENKVVGFSLMLNKNLFFQFVSSNALEHRPNQFLLDAIYKDYENQFVYLGTSFANSGHQRFKEGSGAKGVNCSPVPYKGEFHIAKALLKLPLGPIYRLISNNNCMVPMFLPY